MDAEPITERWRGLSYGESCAEECQAWRSGKHHSINEDALTQSLVGQLQVLLDLRYTEREAGKQKKKRR